MRSQRSAPLLADRLRTRLGVQIVPASGSSSELSSHQMAIRSHPGVQKMPASGISSELSAHQMAPAGAIAHSRDHLCPRASSLSFSSLVSPLRPSGLVFFWVVATLGLFSISSITDAGPASHRVRLWQGGPASTYCRQDVADGMTLSQVFLGGLPVAGLGIGISSSTWPRSS